MAESSEESPDGPRHQWHEYKRKLEKSLRRVDTSIEKFITVTLQITLENELPHECWNVLKKARLCLLDSVDKLDVRFQCVKVADAQSSAKAAKEMSETVREQSDREVSEEQAQEHEEQTEVEEVDETDDPELPETDEPTELIEVEEPPTVDTDPLIKQSPRSYAETEPLCLISPRDPREASPCSVQSDPAHRASDEPRLSSESANWHTLGTSTPQASPDIEDPEVESDEPPEGDLGDLGDTGDLRDAEDMGDKNSQPLLHSPVTQRLGVGVLHAGNTETAKEAEEARDTAPLLPRTSKSPSTPPKMKLAKWISKVWKSHKSTPSLL